MVIKLLGTIAGLVVLAFFMGFNLDNKCNVNILFKTFENVPVFITIMISFAAGILFTLPFAFGHKILKAKKAKEKEEKKAEKTKKPGFFAKNKKSEENNTNSPEKKSDSTEDKNSEVKNTEEKTNTSEESQTTELETGSPV